MNNLIQPPMVGARDGNWVWDGTRWVCDPDCPPTPCPPFSVLQPGGPQHAPFFPPPVTQPPWYPGANGGVSFAPPGSPPPNPIRGSFWWDGSTLWMFDGAAWVATGGANSSSGATPPSGTPPANPAPGTQWFNGTTLFVWDGKAWIPVSQTKTYIQATAPPAPNPGDGWFDGTQFRIWDGSAWELVGPGATVGPVATTSEVLSIIAPGTISGITTSSSSMSIVPITAAPIVDTLAGWDMTTHKYTPTRPGMYQFFTTQYCGGPETGAGHSLIKNDSGTWVQMSQMFVTDAAGGPGTYLTGSGMVKMNGTTDFVRLFGYSSDGNYYLLSTVNPIIHGFLLP